MLLLLFSSCEDPGVVGNEFVDSGAEVGMDTLKVDDYKMESEFPVFTGNRTFLSVGQYEDALFGDLTATGVIRPAVNHSVDTLHPEAAFSLQLGISTDNVYGDTTSTTTVELVEMADTWRAVAWEIDFEFSLTDNVLATAEIDMQDSLVIELPDHFYQEYREFYYNNPDQRDSLYRYEFKSFALRPAEGDKIIAIEAGQSSFLLQNPDNDSAATEIDLTGWAYSLDRTNVPSLPDSLNRIYSTQEQVINFIFQSDRETLGSENVSRAEMTFNQDQERMRNTLPESHVRPAPAVLDLYLQDPEDLEFSLLTANQPSFSVQVDSADYTFRTDLTRYVNQQLFVEPRRDRFIGTLRSNDGIIRSAILANPAADASYPRLLLTFVNSDIESD